MKKITASTLLVTSILGFIGTTQADASEYVAPKSYSEMVAAGELDPASTTEAQWNEFIAKDKAAFSDINDDVTDSFSTDGGMTEESFQIKAGDILVTNRTSSFGLTGHAAMYVGGGKVLEITGYGKYSKLNNYSDFKANNTPGDGWVKIYRTTKSGWGTKTAEYGKSYLTNTDYNLNRNVLSKASTYCSKLVWQSYYYGVGASATSNDSKYHWVSPYELKTEIVGVPDKPVKIYY